MRAVCSLLLTFLALGCGGSESTAKAPVASTSAPPVPTAIPVTLPPKSAPSPELQAMTLLTSHESFALYANLETFLGSDVGRRLAPGLMPLLAAALPHDTDCLTRVIKDAREVAGSAGDVPLLTVRFAPGTAHEVLRACARADAGWASITVDQTDEGLASTDQAVVRRGDVLAVGHKDALKTMLDAKTHPWPPELLLDTDSFLGATAQVQGGSGHGQVSMNATRFLAVVEVNLQSEDSARQAADGLLAALKTEDDLAGLDEPTKVVVAHVRRAIRVESRGKTVHLTLDLEEGSVDQVKDLLGMASYAAFGVKQYLTESKKIEAMVAVRSIGVDYRQALQSETGAHAGKKRLHSFPAVPRQVPRGDAYPSTEADWKPWREIHFEMTAPQRYQYEVKAARDGKSADIIARGDLDGDGKTSELKLHIVLDPKTGELTVPTLPIETNSDE